MSTNTVLLTGATAGIGLATAKHLLQLGWSVIFTGRNSDKIAATIDQLSPFVGQEQTLKGVLCDNSNYDQIQTLAASLEYDNITLDAVILNAGVFYPNQFEHEQLANFEKTMSVNFTGPAMMLQALLPHLNNPTSVVYVSSIVVEKVFANTAIYSASKAAFEALANTLNVEWAERGIRINYLRPGVTLTEIQAKAGMQPEQIDEFEQSLATTPAGRILEPHDMVSALAFLISQGSNMMRGAHIRVDGGHCL
ncbi:SDR family NAD(P)-dependent oxidoreductase [Pseudoalteromonas sp. S16_S37]|uniref:SDR family NAD(P)-dependent oxidoreductase n=1 Tax=Pseudoalteromonas sp. S16_S37 TaxID=2720228 RepID=UPI0016807826|nr:SDR family oxidoreductase [Pseudoalteromonas sp. S16_S37]MBD1583272.1 SDR family oxidoreductase [Pseudoalteromonas sp. S16_S37]